MPHSRIAGVRHGLVGRGHGVARFRPGFDGALESHAARVRAWIHAPGRLQRFL